jgi:hypothetical protein
VVWGRIFSLLIGVKYEVRQGSILGPILFISLVGDMSVSLFLALGMGRTLSTWTIEMSGRPQRTLLRASRS